MYALKTYKLAQDADKVWNGKKWKAARSFSKFQIQVNKADALAVSNYKSKGEDANTIWRQE